MVKMNVYVIFWNKPQKLKKEQEVNLMQEVNKQGLFNLKKNVFFTILSKTAHGPVGFPLRRIPLDW